MRFARRSPALHSVLVIHQQVALPPKPFPHPLPHYPPPTLCGCKGERSHRWVLTDAFDLRSCHQASQCDASAWLGAPFPKGTHSARDLVAHCQAQSQATDVADRYTAPGPILGPGWVRLKPTPLSAHPALPPCGSRGHGSRGRDPFWGRGQQGEMGQQKCSMCSQL